MQCETPEDDGSNNDGPVRQIRVRELTASGICIKCKKAKAIIFLHYAVFCGECLKDKASKQFRHAIKQQSMDHLPTGKVMVACSGGMSSSLMLYLMNESFNRNKYQRSRFTGVVVCHIDESALIEGQQDVSLGTMMGDHEYVVRRLEDVFADEAAEKSDPAERQKTPRERLIRSLSSASKMSSREDLIQYYRQQLLIQVAREHSCPYILLGDSATRTAIKIISGVCKGRGFGLPALVASESTQGDVIILKPMRDLTSKEVAVLAQLCEINVNTVRSFDTGLPAKSSIDRLTEDFILGLQVDFPSTTSTVLKTGFKVETGHDSKAHVTQCPLCGGAVEPASHEWRSSHTVSSLIPPIPLSSPPKDSSRGLCYGCQNVAWDLGDNTNDLPSFVKNALIRED
ncbi:hypothetical protein SmJEL517_g04263 [Synchytrium microbalum]|uniref:Cytoplasmic tRNA 2-thiolation protein 2 n=1 Tax=Synchytrium microbalum TaxID=1806994 RepID=A0A507BYU0_9FUNG|nr:uncharacterized protein SmJEL517_g04263 [Synchytrium microbalum]TPX32592.1 hypothetical protein SmJEL517_g04263 [Synchytrium microbalum]